MIIEKTYDEWVELAGQPVTAVRVVADWLGNIVTVVRVLHTTGVTGLLDGPAFRHIEQAYAGVASRVDGGATPAVAIGLHEVAVWAEHAADRDTVLAALADELQQVVYRMNMLGVDGVARFLAGGSENQPYWHVLRAHTAVLTVLTGSEADGEALHELCMDNWDDTAWNLRNLADDKRARTVTVRVAAGENTATVTLPHGAAEYKAGRVGGYLRLFWVADDEGDVVGNSPTWQGVGETLAKAYMYADPIVVVEYAEADSTGVATPVEDTEFTEDGQLY